MTVSDLLLTVTNLGDPVLLAPGAVLLLAYLLACGTRRTALLWAEAFIASLVLVVLSKLGLRLFGQPVLDIRSPSGHTGVSAVVYLCAAVVLGRTMTPRGRIAMFASAAVLVAAIAWSRVLLGAHDWAEIVSGAAIGGGAALWFARRSTGEPIAPRLRAPLAAAFVALAFLVNGWHATTEIGIRQIAAGHWPRPPYLVRQERDAGSEL